MANNIPLLEKYLLLQKQKQKKEKKNSGNEILLEQNSYEKNEEIHFYKFHNKHLRQPSKIEF